MANPTRSSACASSFLKLVLCLSGWLVSSIGAAPLRAAAEDIFLEANVHGTSITTRGPELRDLEGRLLVRRSEGSTSAPAFYFPNAGDQTEIVWLELPLSRSMGTNTASSTVISELSMDSGSSGRLFGDLNLSPADVGATFYADPRSYPNAFLTATRKLTDGLDGRFRQKLSVSSKSGSTSSSFRESFLFGDLPGGLGVDFQGFRIDSIAFRIDFLTVESPGSDPNNDGQWTDVDLDITVFFLHRFEVFSDGFESGDLSGWSSVMP